MRSKSGLFLIELIIATLFFALSSTVCIQMFVKGHTIAESNAKINRSIIEAQSLADLYQSTQADLDEMLDYYTKGECNGNSFTVYYDASWQQTTQDKAAYKAVLNSSEGDISTGAITLIDINSEEVLYMLNASVYKQLSKGDSYDE